jgi:hypothetical protein
VALKAPADEGAGRGLASAVLSPEEMTMHTDRTTKLLLTVIALGMWVNIGRGLFAPIPSEAQAGTTKVDITHVAGERLLTGEALPVEGPRILAAGKSAATPIIVKTAK